MQARAHPHWNPSWPRPEDEGKEVQVLLDNGSIMPGTLRIHAMIKDAMGNKHPIFVIEDAAGTRRPFVDAEQWRFLTERPQ